MLLIYVINNIDYISEMIILGADFIKTSTGKETTNATITSTVIMLQAIKSYRVYSGKLVLYIKM